MVPIITQFNIHCSLRLVAQDVALSRRKHEFESRREHHMHQQFMTYVYKVTKDLFHACA